MARARIPETEPARLKEELRCLKDERGALLGEVESLQGELCEARRARTRAERRTTEQQQSSNSKIAAMQQEIAQLKKQGTDRAMMAACARNSQLHVERQLVAAQEQLRCQEESSSALKAEYLRLQSENVQLQSERKGCGELMAHNSKAYTLVPAHYPARTAASDIKQHYDELVRELQDELQDQKMELCFARSQARLANWQQQVSEGKIQQLLGQVAQLQRQLETRSSEQQPQQTVGDRSASEALEAEVSKFQSEITKLKTANHGLQQQLQTNNCTVATSEQPGDDGKVLLEEEVAALKATVARYKQVFIYQQEAIDLYPPLAPFKTMNTQPLKVQADNSKLGGCCAKCSVPLARDTIEVVGAQAGAAEAVAGLQQELTLLKEQLFASNGRLKAACEELAQKEVKLSEASNTVATLEQDKLQLEEQGRCACQTYQLLLEHVAELHPQLLHLQSVVSDLEQERALSNAQHQQEIQELEILEQMLVGQREALAAAAGLQQDLSDLRGHYDLLKTQSFELDERLKAACADLAQKESDVSDLKQERLLSNYQHQQQIQEHQQMLIGQREALAAAAGLQQDLSDLRGQYDLLKTQSFELDERLKAACADLAQKESDVSDLKQERLLSNYQHQQEIEEYQQMLVGQREALAAAARLQQELTIQNDRLKTQSFELDGQLKAACADLAQKEVKLSAASNTITQFGQEKNQLQVQSHRALLHNQLLQEQVADLHCQLLQLQYMVSDLQRQQGQQHPPVASEQALVTARQQQLKPLRAVRGGSDPADAPSTPELGAISFSEGRSGLSQPDDSDNASSSSSSSRHPDTTARPADRGTRGVRAVCSMASVVLGIVLSRRKAGT